MNRRLPQRFVPPIGILLLCVAAAAQYPQAWVAEMLAAAGAVAWLAWTFRSWREAQSRRLQHLNQALGELLEGKPVPPEDLSGQDELAELSVTLTRLLRKLQEQADRLEHRELRYRQAFEASLAGTFFWDTGGRFTEVNLAFTRLTGFSNEDVAAGKVTWSTLVPAESADAVRHLWTDLEPTQHNPPFELELVRQDGTRTTAWCETLSSRTDPKCGVGFLWDLSGREPAEGAHRTSAERLRSIWERSVDGMVLTDQHGMVLAVNQSYCELLETTSVEAVGQPVTQPYAAGADGQQLLREYQERFTKRPLDSHAESQVNLRSGRRLELEFVYSLIELRHGNPLYLSIVRDVTERKSAEANRRQMERKLLETQKLESLGVMAGGIAHDFNNLLTVILGNASLAMMQLSESSPLFAYLRNIEKSSMHAADLCKQMLAYSGRGRFMLQHVAINRLIEETKPLLHISVSQNVRLDFELAADLPLIEADPAQIQQVLLNLVTNASEATSNPGGVVTLRTGSLPANRAYLATTYLSPDIPEGEYAFLEVADTGCGMTPDTQARIFDPFFSTKFTGRGLGLAAVWGIVRGHKGALKLQSEWGRGSTFRILLPRGKTCPQETKSTDGPALWRGAGTVLLVDDDVSVRSVTGRMLESFGFTVLTASDGQHGVDTFARYAKDITLVLLDLTMPHMNGEKAFAEMRHLQPDARIVLISGYDERQAVQLFAGKGVTGFIQKPFKAQELNAKLQAILSAHSKQTHGLE